MLQCINCDQEALWVFRTTGAIEQPYCVKHLPLPYRDSGSLRMVEDNSSSKVEEPESAPAEEPQDEPREEPQEDPKPKPPRRRRKKVEADE